MLERQRPTRRVDVQPAPEWPQDQQSLQKRISWLYYRVYLMIYTVLVSRDLECGLPRTTKQGALFFSLFDVRMRKESAYVRRPATNVGCVMVDGLETLIFVDLRIQDSNGPHSIEIRDSKLENTLEPDWNSAGPFSQPIRHFFASFTA